jgi:hypothetical protein
VIERYLPDISIDHHSCGFIRKWNKFNFIVGYFSKFSFSPVPFRLLDAFFAA